MAKNTAWVITVIALALLQTMWPDLLKVQGTQPDLVLILVVYFAMAEGEERAMFTGLLGGMYGDVASNTVLGHHVLGLVLAGYFTARVSTRLVTEHPAVKAGLVLSAAAGSGILYTAVLYVQQPDEPFLNRLVLTVAPGAFFSAIVSPLLFYVCTRMFRPRTAMGGLPR